MTWLIHHTMRYTNKSSSMTLKRKVFDYQCITKLNKKNALANEVVVFQAGLK